MKIDKLEFAIRQRKRNREQEYRDFLINGKSLLDHLRLAYMDLVSPFGWSESCEDQILKEFRLERLPTLDSGRIMFYVCPDIGCGAITGLITRNTEGQIEWMGFGYENDYEGVKEQYPDFHFCFDEADYLQAFRQLTDKI